MTIKTRVQHNIKEHKFVDSTESRYISPSIMKLYNSEVRTTIESEKATSSLLQGVIDIPLLQMDYPPVQVEEESKLESSNIIHKPTLLHEVRSLAWLGFLGIPSA